MEKRIIGTVICISILLSACSLSTHQDEVGNNDWSYSLPNNYVIWHVKTSEIVCGKKEHEHSISTVAGDYVKLFCYNTQYVCLQCTHTSDDELETVTQSCSQYYIIDTLSDEVIGPLSEEEYFENVRDMGINQLSSWIATKPRPEGAVFP